MTGLPDPRATICSAACRYAIDVGAESRCAARCVYGADSPAEPAADNSLDLPFEVQAPQELTLEDAQLTGGLLVASAVLPVDGIVHPALILRFPDPGTGVFRPPVVLVLSPERMAGLSKLIGEAAAAAIALAAST